MISMFRKLIRLGTMLTGVESVWPITRNLPPLRMTSNPSLNATDGPAHSMTTSGPLPSVRSRIMLFLSSAAVTSSILMVWLAPHFSARARRLLGAPHYDGLCCSRDDRHGQGVKPHWPAAQNQHAVLDPQPAKPFKAMHDGAKGTGS